MTSAVYQLQREFEHDGLRVRRVDSGEWAVIHPAQRLTIRLTPLGTFEVLNEAGDQVAIAGTVDSALNRILEAYGKPRPLSDDPRYTTAGLEWDWTVQPLYRVEKWAVRAPRAAEELARRYAAQHMDASRWSPPQIGRVAKAWLKGWRGDRNPWANGKGGNYAAPLRNAYADGARRRQALEEITQGLRECEQPGCTQLDERDRMVQVEDGSWRCRSHA